MPTTPLPTGPPTSLASALLSASGTHAHCRGCHARVNVSEPLARTGWHTVHACAPEHAIEVHVRSPGAEPWAWRYAADAAAASALAPPRELRRRGSLGG